MTSPTLQAISERTRSEIVARNQRALRELREAFIMGDVGDVEFVETALDLGGELDWIERALKAVRDEQANDLDTAGSGGLK